MGDERGALYTAGIGVIHGGKHDSSSLNTVRKKSNYLRCYSNTVEPRTLVK